MSPDTKALPRTDLYTRELHRDLTELRLQLRDPGIPVVARPRLQARGAALQKRVPPAAQIRSVRRQTLPRSVF